MTCITIQMFLMALLFLMIVGSAYWIGHVFGRGAGYEDGFEDGRDDYKAVMEE